MRISKKIVLLLSILILHSPFSLLHSQIGMRELGDSLMQWTGFSPVWSPVVRVKNLRVNGNNVTLYTNITLRDVRWTPQNLSELKRNVSRWVLGHEDGKVTIYSAQTDIETLITECGREGYKAPGKCGKDKCSDLTERNIVLYPSHGLYYNREKDEWVWQRATLWTTVEDLYSREYVRLIQQMLENAGATVLMPRAGLDHHEPGPSGMPRWTEGARYWLIEQGADSAIWNLYDGNEYKDDMKCRAMWVNSLDTPVDMCLALHTDGLDSGNDSTIIGTLVIYTAKDDEGHTVLRDGRDREKTNRNLADWVQTQVVSDLRTIAPEWTRRQLKEANYCESRVPVVPSLILELLSHKNMADMKYGLDPKFRFTASRAVYKGILRYLNGANAVVQPLPVKDLGIDAEGLLRWVPTLDSLEQSAAPSYYMVYIRENEGEWEVQQVEKATRLQLSLNRGTKYDFYVVAGNDGGLSLPSPTISAYLNDKTVNGQMVNGQMVNGQMVNIIDAFDDAYGVEWFADSTYAGIVPGSYACEDYFSCAYIGEQWDFTRANPWVNDDNCGWGACYRDHAGQFTVGNTHDWSVQHGRVLYKMHISYVSSTAGMLNEEMRKCENEKTVHVLDVISGRNRQPLSGALCAYISRHLDAGGLLLFSTDHFNAIDPLWSKRYLHASFYADHATRSGRVISSLPSRQSGQGESPTTLPLRLVMRPNSEQIFSPAPQALQPEQEAYKTATYEDMRCPAAVGTSSPLIYAFPLEAVRDFESIYRRSIQWLLQPREEK